MTIRTDIERALVLTGPWPDPVMPDTSLPEFLLATATQQAERAAIIDASSGRTLNYAELADGVRRVASGLAALGLRPGNVFAIMAPNSPEWLLACCGALAAGGVVTGINPLCTPGEVATQLADADARFVLTVPEFLPTASAAAERAAAGRPGVPARIIVLGPAPGDTIPFAALLAHPGGCGAAPLSAELQQACAERIGCPVGQGYGMTEATAGIALFPVPDERAGELPKAYVVPAQEITPQELIDYVAARVAPHKRIHQVSFTDAIPTSPSGKTLRRLLIAGEHHRS